MSTDFDVVICGGGLAGQTLARQIKLKMPEKQILVVDRLKRPLPESTLKVGESSVETGGHYLADKLELTEYFKERHLFKCGLRYFFGPTDAAIEKRPEFGLSKFPVVHSYQIDRGLLENDLRQMNEDAGVTLLEGARVKNIHLAEDDGPHEVVIEAEGERRTLKTRWVVDATGRGQILQRKLKLKRKREKNCSSAWFRYEGRVDIGDLVSSELESWHDRVPEKNRYYSTNHLMGEGYWVWLIPLGAGNTSVGIVTDDQIHPFNTYKTYELSMQWLRKHEPVLAEHLADLKPMDFLGLRRYSYSSSQVMSHKRWACVGEAGVFADPFYSPGSDLIGFANTITTHMIWLDSRDELTEAQVAEYNNFVIGLNNALTHGIQLGYPLFGKPVVSAAKLIWDNTAAWSFVTPMMFNSTFLDAEKHRKIRSVTAPFYALTTKIQQLLLAWGEKTTGRLTFDFLDYLSIPYLHSLRLRNLKTGKSIEELVADQKENMDRVEELAQVIFMLAVEDTMPERLDELKMAGWLNAWRIGLDPDRWEADGLFEPRSEPRDLEDMYAQIRQLFKIDPAHASAHAANDDTASDASDGDATHSGAAMHAAR
jgi:flavin-dependent dehydrogenase